MFGKNAKVDLELNRDVEQLIKTGGKEKLLPIVQAGEPVLRQRTDLVRNETLTCYNGIPADGCGHCPACKLRKQGLEEYLSKRNR